MSYVTEKYHYELLSNKNPMILFYVAYNIENLKCRMGYM
jgi:hypothetical protein